MSSGPKPELRLDWCSHKAAKFAVENWHYSGTMPSGKVVKIGVWESGSFIGAVMFSLGASPQIHKPFRVSNTEACELTRVALRQHEHEVSKIVAVALRLLSRQSPGIRVVVSYADPEQGHEGVIYQAGGWTYLGPTSPCEHFEYIATGERVHSKTLKTGRRGYATELKARGVIRSIKVWKHKYAIAMDRDMRRQLQAVAKPYPKRSASEGEETSRPATSREEGGASPTLTLQHTEDA